MKLNVHISTCPNDTFMFYAMLHGKVDTAGLEFEATLTDIEELNGGACAGVADLTKISYAAVPLVLDRYQLLSSGSALGRGNGPLLVARRHIPLSGLAGVSVAVPGKMTTANHLLDLMFPEMGCKKEYLFSDIADAVLAGDVETGVLIHEGRFTYGEKDLTLVADLGLQWETRYGLPLPLGGIAVKRSLPSAVRGAVERIVRESVRYAMDFPDQTYDFVKSHARELDDEVIASHIELFVNRYSLDLTEEGRRAVRKLLEGKLTPEESDFLFVG